ncbi:MAG TPA: hypothetical protein VD736_09295 [Nitrososphaera sp.]|nr:hypothetical protein [Nitrososphaera sp.]
MDSKFLILPLAALAVVAMAGTAYGQIYPDYDPYYPPASAIRDTRYKQYPLRDRHGDRKGRA